MIDFLKKQLFTVHQNGKHQVSEVFKFIGPGIIVTVGFIDPGNWAANLAAGASYGYETFMGSNTIYDYADFIAA